MSADRTPCREDAQIQSRWSSGIHAAKSGDLERFAELAAGWTSYPRSILAFSPDDLKEISRLLARHSLAMFLGRDHWWVVPAKDCDACPRCRQPKLKREVCDRCAGERVRVREALILCGLDVWPVQDGPPYLIDVAESGSGLMHLSPVGFHEPEMPAWLDLTADKVIATCAAYLDIRGGVDGDANKGDALTLWRMLVHAAGPGAHVGGSGCTCSSCRSRS